jgi:protein SCO1/2
MKTLKPLAAILVLLAASTSTVAAHSLDELEAQLRDREKYFQPIGKEAPDFTLQDAEGRAVSLEDLCGKVVVLHFIYTNCPDVCPLHAERIAEIQKMVNQTPMRELVQFVTITTDPERDTPEDLPAEAIVPLPCFPAVRRRDHPCSSTVFGEDRDAFVVG